MAFKNHTTVDGDRYPQYDLGAHSNLASVLGRERWTWLIPFYCRGPDGDGVHWPTKDGGRVGTATSHPSPNPNPRQPLTLTLSGHGHLSGRRRPARLGLARAPGYREGARSSAEQPQPACRLPPGRRDRQTEISRQDSPRCRDGHQHHQQMRLAVA
eukprot:scaffold18529_cov62-Phaeocystis_antarctica.AAC.1